MYHIDILYIMQYGIYTILFAYAILKYTIAAIICYKVTLVVFGSNLVASGSKLLCSEEQQQVETVH